MRFIIPPPGLAHCRRSRLNSNVRRRKGAMRHANRVSAIRRELNSHDAAKPRIAKRSLRQAPAVNVECRATRKATVRPFGQAKQSLGKTGAVPDTKNMGRLWLIGTPSRSGAASPSVGSSGPVDWAFAFSPSPSRRRLACVAQHVLRRGAGSIGGGQAQIAGSAACTRRRLTPRSRRGPTASHQARRPALFIIRPSGLASRRRSRLNSNVRRRKGAMWHANRVSAMRRELNSHDAAEPRTAKR